MESGYLWAPEHAPARVLISFDVVDRLGAEVMRGFGLVPKRGAEVGGFLLGEFEEQDKPLIRIDEFVPVPSEHRWGPSYKLSEKDLARFDEELEKVGRTRVVGYFRSHTREPLQLVEEDLELLYSRFGDARSVCLLVKPYPTRPSEATFVFRRNGQFPMDPVDGVFPFRRKELGGGSPPRHREALPEAVQEPARAPSPEPEPEAAVPVLAPAPRPSRGWFWPALAVALFALGLLGGMQIGVRWLMKPPEAPAAPPPLIPFRLTAQGSGNPLTLQWKMSSELERKARRGQIRIEDEGNRKSIDLTREDLLAGSARYQAAGAEVLITLEIAVSDVNGVTETVRWRQGDRLQ